MATTLTKHDWMDILQNENMTNQLDLSIFTTLYSFDKHQAPASIIAQKLNTTYGNINLEVGRYAKRIAKFYDISFTARENQKEKFWDLFFNGWGDGKLFIWELKSEIQEALKELNMIVKNKTIKTKNILLYGAPGVGKTHNYQRLISMIENGEDETTIFETITANNKTDNFDKSTFETIKSEKRLEFVTFHQSYSYEDFIEGFRPNEDGKIELKNGVFKSLSREAEINLLKSKNRKEILFTDAINSLLRDKIENEEVVAINLKRADSYYNIFDYNENTVYFEKQNGDKRHTLSMKTLEKMYYEGSNNIINGGLAPYYNPLLEKLLKLKQNSTIEKVEQKNHYIIIDEINRGNISKIFGELITLIEEDKRDSYEVTLPYSKEKFKIPSNLYIIATMNSTDKSIATMDIALRRRFTFIKMKPNPELVDDEKAQALMKKLNKYIKDKRGEEYQLGHSYFMNLEGENDLEFAIEYKIKPLLEEYFYGEEIDLDEVIGYAPKS